MIVHKKQILAIIVVGLLALLPACWPFSKKSDVKKQDLCVINVLDKNSYYDCRIAGSINVAFEEIENFAKQLDRNAEIVVYCANYMCSSSSAAVQKLMQMGFDRVWAYEGGTAEWYQMGLNNEGKYPIEGTCRASYLSASNEKPEHTEQSSVPVIDIDELHEKMMKHGMLSTAQVPALSQEGQQAAA